MGRSEGFLTVFTNILTAAAAFRSFQITRLGLPLLFPALHVQWNKASNGRIDPTNLVIPGEVCVIK